MTQLLDMKQAINFAQSWGDTSALNRIKASPRNKDLQKSNAENTLKEVSMRFQYSINQNTLMLWARDIIDAGHTDDNLATVCKSIPFKFEKMPTLAQIMELLRPYSFVATSGLDELTDLTQRCYPHLKAKFLALSDQETLTKMADIYAVKVFPGLKDFSPENRETVVLCDWLRTYFKKGAEIIEQGYISNQAHHRNDTQYFIRHLKSYAMEHKL